MTRVIAGVAGGKRLAVPGGRWHQADKRPRAGGPVRHGPVGILLAGRPVTRWLDLYAGSGAVGLEALSRGAQSVLLVESDARAVEVIRANIAAVGLPRAHEVPGRNGVVSGSRPARGDGQGSTSCSLTRRIRCPRRPWTEMLSLACRWLAQLRRTRRGGARHQILRPVPMAPRIRARGKPPQVR